MKKIFFSALALTLVFSILVLGGCASTGNTDAEEPQTSEGTAAPSGENPVATIEVKDFGTITVELYYDEAPETVKNFISLANSGFYNGLIFHRIIEDFMIQGGDPAGDGTGGPGYSIKGEFSANSVENNIKHVRGTISMGRRGNDNDSAGSQFFICQSDYTYGDGKYAAFGMVTSGIEVVDAIAAVATDANDKPLTDVVIASVTVDTKGVTYGEPATIKK